MERFWFRSGVSSDMSFYLAGVEEIYALEGNAWNAVEEEDSRVLFNERLQEDRVIIAMNADERVGFLLWEVGSAVPFVPHGACAGYRRCCALTLFDQGKSGGIATRG